jgi:branched-chain amino acid transport system substrate-binding protein
MPAADTAGRATCTEHSARMLTTVPHPTVDSTTVLDARIVVRPAGVGADAEPLLVGFLSDMPVGQQLGRYLDPIILAFEDAMNEGRLTHAIEIRASHVVGLPTGQPENVRDAFSALVVQGCLIVASTGVTNNALVLMPVIEQSRVPYITMAGTTRFIGDFCFSLANGGHGEEAAILAAYLADRGLRRVVLTGEGSPGDAEYHRFFVEQASLYGVEILEACYFATRPSDDELDNVLRHFRDDLQPDALVYCGFGLNSGQLNPALDRIGWDPPKVMNAAIMWALAGPTWMAALDGWIGIEQSLGDHESHDKNRNWGPLLERHQRRFGYRPDDTMVALLYDQGRAMAEAIINAPELTSEGLAVGLERIKMMPSTLGGPRTYIGFGPNDHRGYRGDFMFMKQLRDGKFHLADYHWPQWPINRSEPAAREISE